MSVTMHMDENSDEPPQRTNRSGTIDLIDPDRLVHDEARTWVQIAATRALSVLGAAGEVRVRLLDDQAMSDLHRRSLGLDGPTDVLTFDLSEPGGDLDVDLYVCIPEARRRSLELGHPIEYEVLLYIIHGMLHCLGHDDHDPEQAARMHAEEDRLLEAIGVGAVYARTLGSSAVIERNAH